MTFEKINLKTIREHVYDQLRQAILHGKILPGQSISLRSLAKQFGVSLMPIREALWQLETEKIILVESNRRFHVNSLSVDEMKEIIQLRKLLEAEAAKKACRIRPDDAIPGLEKLLKNLKTSVTSHSRYMMKNLDFHFFIYSHADSPNLYNFIRLLWARSGPYYVLRPTDKKDRLQRIVYHEAMFKAFVDRDEDKLIQALHNDTDHASELVLPFLASRLEETADQ